jgi:hypothetical protein
MKIPVETMKEIIPQNGLGISKRKFNIEHRQIKQAEFARWFFGDFYLQLKRRPGLFQRPMMTRDFVASIRRFFTTEDTVENLAELVSAVTHFILDDVWWQVWISVQFISRLMGNSSLRGAPATRQSPSDQPWFIGLLRCARNDASLWFK